MNNQAGILDLVPPLARYQYYCLKPNTDPKPALQALADFAVEHQVVVGFGQSLLNKLGCTIPAMQAMPPFEGVGIETPVTPSALWCWVRGEDRGELLHRARRLRHLLADAFEVERVVDGFKYDISRDLSGYEDGTENPEGDEAVAAAFSALEQVGIAGSSYVAVQQWQHDLDAFQAMSKQQRDHTIGREEHSNEELEDAPESAHVKRTAQEDFEPEAFVLRRSMPWADASHEGLMFVAFGNSFAAFEAQMQRMVGNDDGIVDALFDFTRPVTGNYFWCPPVHEGALDLRAVLE